MLSSCMSTKPPENTAVFLVAKFLAVLSSRMHGWHFLFPGAVLGRIVLGKTRKDWVANIFYVRAPVLSVKGKEIW